MSHAAPPRAVLDADVIFSRLLHELFGRLAAEAGLLSLTWSDELLAEAARSLHRGKGLSQEVAAPTTPESTGTSGLSVECPQGEADQASVTQAATKQAVRLRPSGTAQNSA